MRTLLATLGILIMTTTAAAAPPSDVRETRAKNGLRIITKEAFAKDLIALNLYVDGGNRTETARLSGLSHYYEHLIFRGGTKKQKELESRKHFMSIGEFTGWTSSDVTCYGFLVPASSFDDALARFVDAVMNVEVTQEKVNREREVVLSEFKQSYGDSPNGWMHYNLLRTAFKVHPYGRTTIGLRDVIEQADLERFKTFYAERYVPNHMVVAVVGAIPHDVAAEKVARAWESYAPGKESFETGEVEPVQDGLRVIVEPRRSEVVYGCIGFKAPPASSPDAHVLAVLAHVLGGGESSRLDREVKMKRALALSVGAWFDDCKHPGLLGLSFSAEPGKEVAAIEAIAKEAARLGTEPPDAAELERVKTKIASDYVFTNESYLAQANRLTWFGVVGDPSLGGDWLDRIRSVRPEEVATAARRYFGTSTATASLVVPDSEKEKPSESAIAAALAPLDAKTERAPRARTLVKKLANGITVIAREDHSAPVVACVLKTKDPLAWERREGTGVLADYLIGRGAGGLSREAFAARIDELGIRFGTDVDHDFLTGSVQTTRERFEDGLDLLSKALLAPAFDAAELEKAREELITRIKAVEDDGFAFAGREFQTAVFGDERYGRPAEGTVDTVKLVTRDDIVAWHRAALRPSRTIVAIAGDLDAESAVALVERRFGALAEPDAPPPGVGPRSSTPPGDRLIDRPREQVCFRLGHRGIAMTDPDWIPLMIGIRHLSSEVFFRFVYENGMAYRAWTYLGSGLLAKPFTFEMGVSTANFPKARSGLEAMLRELAEKGLTEEQFAKAKSEIVSRHLLAQQTVASQASSLAHYEALGIGWRRLDELPAIVEKTTLAQVNAALERDLHPDKLVIAVVGDLKKAGLK